MDTVEYYLKLKADAKAKKLAAEEARRKYKQENYACCGELKTGPHYRICVNADEGLGFKNRFVQHYPSFFTVEAGDYFVLNFNTQDELLTCEFVNRWKKNTDERKFHRYSLADAPKYHACHADISLMVEYDNGKKWVCIGRLKTTDGLNLPKWEPVE